MKTRSIATETAIANLSATVGASVIHRINYPKRLTRRMTRREVEKGNLRPLLSSHDEQDARQTVALALCTVGLDSVTLALAQNVEALGKVCPLFDARKGYQHAARSLGMARWKAAFRATRRTLRIDRRVREDAYSFSDSPELDIAIEHKEISEARRAKLAKEIRYAHTLLHAAYGADISRKRRATFRAQLSTLRAYSAIWAGRFAKHPLCAGKGESAIRLVQFRFEAYLTKGEAALTAAAFEGVAPRRATSLVNERGELKTFAAL